MKIKLICLSSVMVLAGLTACSKQSSAPAAEQLESSVAVVNESSEMTAQQQAQIDALDQPLKDEHNTDVPESVANAPAASAKETAH